MRRNLQTYRNFPPSHKTAVFSSLIYRLTSLPLLAEPFREEVATNKHLKWASGFTYDIDRIIHEKFVSRAFDSATTLLFVRDPDGSVCPTYESFSVRF